MKMDKRAHSDVPAEEMLSDEYYEQDGEEQSDSVHYRGFHQSTGSDSCLQRKSTNVNRHVPRKSRISYDAEVMMVMLIMKKINQMKMILKMQTLSLQQAAMVQTRSSVCLISMVSR